ncbi:MAG: LysM peptidoglycan-binding domain-containing protein, partial [Methanobrevibacter sp.]|uniref:LysM peptidoglycan-binding domain-containing protein n=1 Tax=Methanobrevibacter sp. TaxID=66852 RepID=UPI001B0BF41E
VNDIMSLNNLSSNALSIGQTLLIPVGGSNSSGSNNGSEYITYTVKSGDNLYDIANKYNTSVNSIKNLNNLTSNFLSIGQVLKIPTDSSQIVGPNYITYIVRRGDSLYSIARKFDMTVDELIRLNNLKSNVLNIGQSLKVKVAEFQLPSEIKECFGMGYSEPTYQTYTVKSGDSLYIIAKKFNTSVDNLVLLNNLASNNLQIGQVLKIKEIL